MIRMAAHKSHRDRHCRFEVGDLEHTSSQHRADVVSAASLLFVLPDPTAALHQLWRCVRPQGYLLVIETTNLMTPELARRVNDTTPSGRRLALHLWAHARNGKAIAAKVYESLPSVSTLRTPLLHGIVATWMFKKGPA